MTRKHYCAECGMVTTHHGVEPKCAVCADSAVRYDSLDLDDVAFGHPVAQAELAELRKDAARYRWLREHSTQPSEPWSTHSAPESLDAAVDESISAIAEEKEGGR